MDWTACQGLSCSPRTDAGAYSLAWASAALPSAGNGPVTNTFMSRAAFIRPSAANTNQAALQKATEVWAGPALGAEQGLGAGPSWALVHLVWLLWL